MIKHVLVFSDHPNTPSGLARITREIIWNPVVGYESVYEVSSDGHVRRCDNHPNSHQNSPHICEILGNKGYLQVWLHNDGVKKRYSNHVLVAESFFGPRPLGYEIDHINCIKTDNRFENLEYVTKLENLRRQKANGLLQYGEKNHAAILTKDQVEDIRVRYLSGESQYLLAAEYKTAQSNIHKIVTRKTWTK